MWMLLVCLYLGISSVDPFAQTPEDRYNFFNVDLLQAVNEQTDGNVILSPASAKLALAILAEGAAGQTRKELLSALRLPAEEAVIRSVAQQTVASLRSYVNGTEIDVASCIWIRPGLRVINYYVNVLREYYGGDIQPLNFADSYTTANTINDWVRQATRNKIQTLVPSGGIPSDTRLMLTSALYFKGQWLKSFNKHETRLRCFNVPNGGCQDTYLMDTQGKYRYGYIASLDADAIAIPYSDRKTAMVVLLPSNKDNDQYVQILSKDLSYVPMSSILANLREREVHLVLPKFSIESRLDLRAPLLRVGIRDIFELTANLSGMSLDGPLRVSSIIQNAKIEVDEEGTIAAAATAVAVIPLMSSTVPVFRANRPFLFAIVDLQTNGTLFAGRFIRPDQTG